MSHGRVQKTTNQQPHVIVIGLAASSAERQRIVLVGKIVESTNLCLECEMGLQKSGNEGKRALGLRFIGLIEEHYSTNTSNNTTQETAFMVEANSDHMFVES